MTLRRRLAVPVVTASVALAALLALRPLSTSRALAIWVVLVAAIALLLLVRQTRERTGTAYGNLEAALRRPAVTSPAPVELLRTDRDLELGIAGAAHAHHRLLPILREAAAARLASRHGVELERRPDAARELLGDEVWELLRPDRSAPANRFDPGVPREQVVRVIERVESL